jgi:hypothetical protein
MVVYNSDGSGHSQIYEDPNGWVWLASRRHMTDSEPAYTLDAAPLKRNSKPGVTVPFNCHPHIALTLLRDNNNGWQEPIACGGVAVFPNDVIVADGDGVVVIPAALLDAVVPLAVEQEQYEAWVIAEVAAGVPLPGLYPPDEATLARYRATLAART